MLKLTALLTSGAAGHRIENLTGLEFATNLTELILNFTYSFEVSPINISDVSPLAKLTKLTRLDLKGQ